MTEPATTGTESWDDVPLRDCYTKVQGQRCGPEHGWASWLGTFYRCTGTKIPGVAVAALDGDERGVAAPTSPPLPVATAAGWPSHQPGFIWVSHCDVPEHQVDPVFDCRECRQGHWERPPVESDEEWAARVTRETVRRWGSNR